MKKAMMGCVSVRQSSMQFSVQNPEVERSKFVTISHHLFIEIVVMAGFVSIHYPPSLP